MLFKLASLLFRNDQAERLHQISELVDKFSGDVEQLDTCATSVRVRICVVSTLISNGLTRFPHELESQNSVLSASPSYLESYLDEVTGPSHRSLRPYGIDIK